MTESALVQSIGSWLYDKKARDIIALKVAHLTVITDYMVIASGRNVTQVKALADEVDEKMAEAGWILRRSEGGTEGRWIVMDYGSILVHIFNQEERTYYNLERLWRTAATGSRSPSTRLPRIDSWMFAYWLPRWTFDDSSRRRRNHPAGAHAGSPGTSVIAAALSGNGSIVALLCRSAPAVLPSLAAFGHALSAGGMASAAANSIR